MHTYPAIWPPLRVFSEKALVLLLLLVVAVLAGCGAERSSTFKNVVYAGVSANVSRVEPDTSSSTIFSVADEQAGGAGLIVGIDINEKLAAEARYTDLGSAILAPSANVSYQAAGASLLYYALGDARAADTRSGLTGFVRGGLNLLMHDSSIALDSEDNTQFVAGLGVDYLFSDRIALRAEADFHDVDASAFHFGLIYRFGSQPDSAPQYVGRRPQPQQPTIARPTPQQPAVIRPPQPLPDIASLPQSQQPQVAAPPVRQPQIVQPPIRQPVTANTANSSQVPGTRLVNGEVKGVNFASGSARLQTNAFRILDAIAAEMRQKPSVRVELQIHTNGTRGSRPALNLARARALVVGRLLLSRGVNQNQLTARAFGANQPRVSDGQLGNQRMELRILNP